MKNSLRRTALFALSTVIVFIASAGIFYLNISWQSRSLNEAEVTKIQPGILDPPSIDVTSELPKDIYSISGEVLDYSEELLTIRLTDGQIRERFGETATLRTLRETKYFIKPGGAQSQGEFVDGDHVLLGLNVPFETPYSLENSIVSQQPTQQPSQPRASDSNALDTSRVVISPRNLDSAQTSSASTIRTVVLTEKQEENFVDRRPASEVLRSIPVELKFNVFGSIQSVSPSEYVVLESNSDTTYIVNSNEHTKYFDENKEPLANPMDALTQGRNILVAANENIVDKTLFTALSIVLD